MISDESIPDVDQAARTANYALTLAIRKLRLEFDDKDITPADCIALAAITVAKLNMMHDCDMRYLEMERWDRRTPSPAPKIK